MNEHDDAQLKALLKRHFDPVAIEPIPARMFMRGPAWIGYAKALILVGLGIAIGLAAPLLREPPPAAPAAAATFPMRAALAHAVYAPEVRHPVEVDASQQEHLVRWLSKRLGLDLKVPVLAAEGFELLGASRRHGDGERHAAILDGDLRQQAEFDDVAFQVGSADPLEGLEHVLLGNCLGHWHELDFPYCLVGRREACPYGLT